MLGGLFGGAGKKAKKDDVEDAIDGLPPTQPSTHTPLPLAFKYFCTSKASNFVLVKQVLLY